MLWVAAMPLRDKAQGSDAGASPAGREIEDREAEECHVAFKCRQTPFSWKFSKRSAYKAVFSSAKDSEGRPGLGHQNSFVSVSRGHEHLRWEWLPRRGREAGTEERRGQGRVW